MASGHDARFVKYNNYNKMCGAGRHHLQSWVLAGFSYTQWQLARDSTASLNNDLMIILNRIELYGFGRWRWSLNSYHQQMIRSCVMKIYNLIKANSVAMPATSMPVILTFLLHSGNESEPGLWRCALHCDVQIFDLNMWVLLQPPFETFDCDWTWSSSKLKEVFSKYKWLFRIVYK